MNEPSFAVVRSYVDQLDRAGDTVRRTISQINRSIDRAERLNATGQPAAAAAELNALADDLRGAKYADLRAALRALADTLA